MSISRKPEFIESNPPQTEFSKLVSREYEAAKSQNPNAKYVDVVADVAKRRPSLYQQHQLKIGGNEFAQDSYVIPPDQDYFRQVAKLVFSELRRANADTEYADAVSLTMDLYPRLHEKHIAERVGTSVCQTPICLSDRTEASKKPLSKGIKFDRFRFARKALPVLTRSHLTELKRDNKNATYETALRSTAEIFGELWLDYQLACGA